MSDKLKEQIEDLVAMAASDAALRPDMDEADIDELFLDMIEMYLGDLGPEELAEARRYFDAAVAALPR